MKNRYKDNYYSKDEDDVEASYEDVDVSTMRYSKSIGKESNFFSRVIPSKENKEYAYTVYRGFAWIFMLVTSFLTIFLIFKTPYYNYYSQVEPVVIEEGTKNAQVGEDIQVVDDALSGGNNQIVENIPNTFIEDNTNNIVEPLESSKDAPNKNTAVNPPRIIAPKTESNLYSSKEDSDITKLLKNEDVANVAETPNNNVKVVENNTQAPGNSEAPAALQSKNNVVVQKNSTEYVSKVSAVWIVNIYSTRNKAILPEKLQQIVKMNKNVFNNANFYFTQYMLNGRANYRISVVKTNRANQVHGYETQQEASDFCAVLRESKLDCFVSSIYSDVLSTSLVKP